MRLPTKDRIIVWFWSNIDYALDNIPAIYKFEGRWKLTRWGDWGCLYPKLAQNHWVKVVMRCEHKQTKRVTEKFGDSTLFGDECLNCGTTSFERTDNCDCVEDED